jgi:hypothetical protein
MRDWLPHIVGFGLVGLLLAFIRRNPESEWTAALLTYYGVRPSGTDGHFRPVDHFKAAGVSVVLCVVLLGISIGALGSVQSFDNNSRGNWTLAAAGFAAFLLSLLSLACAMIATWHGIRAQLRPESTVVRQPNEELKPPATPSSLVE